MARGDKILLLRLVVACLKLFLRCKQEIRRVKLVGGEFAGIGEVEGVFTEHTDLHIDDQRHESLRIGRLRGELRRVIGGKPHRGDQMAAIIVEAGLIFLCAVEQPAGSGAELHTEYHGAVAVGARDQEGRLCGPVDVLHLDQTQKLFVGRQLGRFRLRVRRLLRLCGHGLLRLCGRFGGRRFLWRYRRLRLGGLNGGCFRLLRCFGAGGESQQHRAGQRECEKLFCKLVFHHKVPFFLWRRHRPCWRGCRRSYAQRLRMGLFPFCNQYSSRNGNPCQCGRAEIQKEFRNVRRAAPAGHGEYQESASKVTDALNRSPSTLSANVPC